MAGLRELTLEELSISIHDHASKSSLKDAPAWQALVRLVDAATSGERDEILTANRKWLLRTMSVEGFRGAKHEIHLKLDSPHGITVLFGENGSGKSSLAEALRVALEGRTGATHLGTTGGVHELWGIADQRSQGVDKAKVNVVLVDETTTDVLTIRAVIDSAGAQRDGFLESQGQRTEFSSDSKAWLAWADSIRASPPVFAYAELADELQKKKDLQVWLTSCLAMDNASRVFEAFVKSEVEAALAAEKVIAAARSTSERAALLVDDGSRGLGLDGITSLEWALWDSTEALDVWLQANDLLEREKRSDVLDRDTLASISTWARDFQLSCIEWSDAATTALLTAQVTDALLTMNEQVLSSGQGENGGKCPTCGCEHEDWRGHLQIAANDLKAARDAAANLKKFVRESTKNLHDPLATCLEVLPEDFDAAAVAELRHLVAEYARVSSNDDLDVRRLSAISELSKWAQRPGATALIEAALNVSGLVHEWRCNRWDAVSSFVTTFQTEIDRASMAGTLKSARSKWNSLLAGIRTARSADLQALVGPAVATLLSDVGISVAAIDITKAESRLDLVNANGQVVELAHLSAGQRNALILGPVIATAESGIFGFSVLDDPVHAFDDFRVDRLSSTLAQIGRNQALILTTHDARFVAYLRVHSSMDFSVLSTTRDEDGKLTLNITKDAPAELVQFAEELASDLHKASAPSGQSDIIALLRMALDEAFEQLALRHFARLPSAQAANDRAQFGKAMLTEERKVVLRQFMADSPTQLEAFTSVWQAVALPSKRWSKAVHNPNSTADVNALSEDIAAAGVATAGIREIRW
jgi:energy-coupling factor transporter ATP-binding protein EcfA2